MADTTPETSQSSQAGSSQSTQQADAGGGSQSSQATGGTTQTQAPERLEWVPDRFWDAKDGVKGKEFRSEFDKLAAFKAADDSRKFTLPQKPEDFKLQLPKTFKAPEGIEFKLDETDPLFAQARIWAQKNGLSQDAFEQGLEMIAARDVGTQQMLKTARDQEIAKLGANGTARVTAVNTFLDAKGYGALKGMMVTAEIVQTLEKWMSDMTQSGSYSQQHRNSETAPKVSDEEWNKMSYGEQREYAMKHQDKAA